MATRFPSARHQAVLAAATGYRRWSRLTFSRNGLVRVLEPTSGRFTQDARRAGRWDGNLAFTGNDMIDLARRPSSLLSPFGTRVDVELGLEMLDGTISSVPYGSYEISSSRIQVDAGQRVVNVGLTDRSSQVERYRFETTFTVAAGTDLATMVNQVVTNRIGLNPFVSATGTTLGAARVFGLDTNSGPWEEILDVLAGFSRTAWYDRVGDIRIGATTVDAGSAYPLDSLTSLSADFDTLPPNVVVVRGEPEGKPPVFAVAMDTDPGSPTFAGASPGGSPYGRVTLYYSSPLLTTNPQAQSAANTILANNLGAGATSTLTRPFDPTVDAGDVVSFEASTYAVDAVSLDLAGETSLQVRELA
jgi:hypothetical protein